LCGTVSTKLNVPSDAVIPENTFLLPKTTEKDSPGIKPWPLTLTLEPALPAFGCNVIRMGARVAVVGGVFVLVAVGGTGVLVGGKGVWVAVGGTGVLVVAIGAGVFVLVAVGGIGVLVALLGAGVLVAVGGAGVLVGGIGVLVAVDAPVATVRLRAPEGALASPALLNATAVILYVPSASGVVVTDQWPMLSERAPPRSLVPAWSWMLTFGSDVPVRVGWLKFVVVPPEGYSMGVEGTAGGIESTLKLKGVTV
jgi:hypothetical protein